MAEQLGPFLGARASSGRRLAALSQYVNEGFGQVEAFAERPVGAEQLFVSIENNNIRMRLGDYRPRTFVDGDVSVAADTVTLTGETAFASAASVALDPYKLTTTGALPAGLDAATVYFLRVLSTGPDVIAFYNSRADAEADTSRVVITAAVGGGVHTVGGVPANAAATTFDGYGPFLLGLRWTRGKPTAFQAPERITFVGDSSFSKWSWWWA